MMLVIKKPPVNAGDTRDNVYDPWAGKIPGEGNGNPLQYSCLENPMDRGAWQATVHRVTNSWMWLKQPSTQKAHVPSSGEWSYLPLLYLMLSVQFSSVQFSGSVLSNSLPPQGLQHARPPFPSPTPGVYSNSCPLCQ